MWQRLDDEHGKRVEAEPLGHGTVLAGVDDPRDGTPVTMQRWRHTDGRLAVHVSDADPELLELSAGRDIIAEYDLPGVLTVPNPVDPLDGARPVRYVAANFEPPADSGSEPDCWALLYGWS